MSDYIDQVFENADLSKWDATKDVSASDLIEQTETPEVPVTAEQTPTPTADPGRIAGQNVVERNPLESLSQMASGFLTDRTVDIQDFIDNTFQGDQKTKEQFKEEALAAQAKDAESFKEQSSLLGGGEAPEVGRVLAGGSLGAAESILNTGEILGDTAKYMASLGNVKEDQNPFSSKYEWASWDLGKDDAGAKSGVGQVAQGFLEFGLLMGATGGFNNLPGAATKYAQAGTALGKAGVVAQAGAYGAAAGLAADMMSATRGEGNLSNLIKEHAPDWYPTWATALAVDEDDSPWEAMLKTGLEGMGMGFAADGLGAYLGGVREARAIRAAGGTEEEAAAGAVRMAQQISENSTPFTPRTDDAAPLYQRPVADQVKAYNDGMDSYKDAPRIEKSQLSVQAQFDLAKEGSMGFDAVKFTELPNGTRVEWDFSHNRDIGSAYSLRGDQKVYEVSWDINAGEEGLKQYGRRLMTDFNRMAREEMKPGTVLANAPADDTYTGLSKAQARRAGEEAPAIPSIRERLYTRAGFGKVDAQGYQYAIVRGTPDGRGRWLQPIDLPEGRTMGEALVDAKEAWVKAQQVTGASPRELSRKWEALSMADRQAKVRDYIASGSIKPLVDAQAELDKAIDSVIPGMWKGVDASMAAFPDKVEGLQALGAQMKQGIPATWDDVAQNFPEFFVPGTRAVTPDFHAGVYKALDDLTPDGGFTINPFTGEVPTNGTVVAIDGKSLEAFGPNDVAGFIADNSDLLSRDDVFLGGWYSEITGRPVVEISRLVPDHDQAVALGKVFDQEGVFRLDDFEYVPTGGADELKHTIGAHLDTQMGKPMESRPVDPTTAVQQQMAARTSVDAVGVSQPSITRPQLRRIARAVGDEPTQILRQMVRENPINLQELSSVSRQSVEEVVNEAAEGIQKALGAAGDINFDAILKQQVGQDELLTRAGIVQVRGLMQELTDRLYQSSYNILKLGDANMDNMPQVARMADELKALMRIHKESANAYSRMLSTYKIKVPGLGIEIDNPFKPPTVEEVAKEIKDADKVLDDLVKKMASGDIKAQNEAFRIANALVLSEGDPSKMPTVWKFIRQIAGGDALSIMYNSMLSGPKTHEINLLSNALNTFYRPIAAATGGQRQAAGAAFYGFGRTMQDAFSMAGKAMKDGPISEGSKTMVRATETAQKLKLLQRSAEVSGDAGFKAAVGVIDTLHKVAEFPLFSWPSKLLAGGDEFFKVMVSRMEFNSQQMMAAMEQAKGMEGSNVDAIFRNLVKENADKAFDAKTGAILDDNLLAAAKDVTFQTELEGWAKSFGQFVNAVPPLRIFFPFVKTGHNIMVYAGTHVPVLNRFLSEYKTVMNGTDEYAKAVMKGREAYGRMIVIGGGIATANGIITGNGPADPQERATWMMNNQPRSINLSKLLGIPGENGKDKFLDYSRIEPFGQILSGVADVYDMFTRGQLSEDRAQYMMGYLTYAIASNFTNKSYMQGVVPLGQILTPGWQGANALASLPAEALNNFIPLSGLRRTMANAMTPYRMEFNSQLERLAYSASGSLVDLGAPAADWLTGEDVPSISGGVNSVLPLAIGDRGGSIVKDKLEDIEFDSSIILKTLGSVKLKPIHKRRLAQLMAGDGALEKRLEEWVTDPTFDEAVEDFKLRLRAGEQISKENQHFYRGITDIILENRDYAIEELKREFPELAEEIMLNKWSKRPGSEEVIIPDMNNLINLPLK